MPTNLKNLGERLWDVDDSLQGNPHLKSAEYSIPVVGLIFLRSRLFAPICTVSPVMPKRAIHV